MQAGQLRTKIRIQKKIITGVGAHATTSWVDIGNTVDTDPPKIVHCEWLPLGGSETWVANSLQIVDAANVTIRFNVSVTSQCRLIKDGVIYEIIAPNDPDQRKQWLKFKAKAAVMG